MYIYRFIRFTAALHFIVVLSCAWGIEMRISLGLMATDSSSNEAFKWPSIHLII